MKNDILKKTGQLRNVRVEYGFGAVCAVCTVGLELPKTPSSYQICYLDIPWSESVNRVRDVF